MKDRPFLADPTPTTENVAVVEDVILTAPSHEEIAAAAYALFSARGYEHGHDTEDWLRAEELLLHKRVQGES